MKQTLMTILRDKNTTMAKFRRAAELLGFILAKETANLLEKQEVKIDTPISQTSGYKLKNDIVFIPILRSALSILSPFLKFFENAKVGFVGLKRDEKTAIAHLYYKNLPKISQTDDVVILDPMIATGGTGVDTIKILIDDGVKEDKIIYIAVICAKTGIERIKNKYPKVKIIFVEQDEKLTDKKYIIPGLGDFGDRYFGTL